MDINKIHLIKGTEKNRNVMFYYPSFSILEINDNLFYIIESLINGNPVSYIEKYFNISSIELEKTLSDLAIACAVNFEPDLPIKKRSISRITLHISNDCNLRCSYCYAFGGSYNQPRNMMSFDVADDFVNFCVTNFDQIGNIVFFGGEPLMNYKIIEYICQKFENLYIQHKIAYIPQWGIITNGTILNKTILEIIKKYIKFITISIDGPKDINDYNRKFVNNTGSYDKISIFINTIKKETDISIKYEATYTLFHIESNVSEKALTDFFHQEFAITGTIVRDINLPNDEIKNPGILSDSYNESQITSMNFPEGFWSILAAIVYKIRKEMCPVGNNIVAISTDGYIYPCHMNNGFKDLELGNIAGDNVFNNKKKYICRFPYLNSILKNDNPCLNCWAQVICGGCSIRWFFDNTTEKYNTFPNAQLCQANKKHIERILLIIVNLKKDKNKWTNLLKLLSRNKLQLN